NEPFLFDLRALTNPGFATAIKRYARSPLAISRSTTIARRFLCDDAEDSSCLEQLIALPTELCKSQRGATVISNRGHVRWSIPCTWGTAIKEGCLIAPSLPPTSALPREEFKIRSSRKSFNPPIHLIGLAAVLASRFDN